MKLTWIHTALVFLAAFAALSIHLPSASIGTGWIDPVLHYGAQDESTYTHQAIRMATHGGWMTPSVLGRWMFEKPPLLMWLSAVTMKLFGIGRFTARVPALLAGALVIALCFTIASTARSSSAGVITALLCYSNQVLFTMSRHNMTDILLTACITAILAVLAFDPQLSRQNSRVFYVITIAGSILTKSIGGLLPALAAFLFTAICFRPAARQLRRIVLLTGLAAAVASPWFVYSFIAHRQWFLTDMGFQLISHGLRPHQTSPENHLSFYLIRIVYAAPVTLVLLCTGVLILLQALRRRDVIPMILVCYLAVAASGLMVFRFHSEQYLTPVMPALILVAVISSPLVRKPLALPLAGVIALVLWLKASNPERPWGIDYRPAPITAMDELSRYCQERRGNDLYILDVPDEFHALALPLARVHYGFIDPDNIAAGLRPHIAYLGILQPAAKPLDASLYVSRLREWGLNSTEPLATGITAHNVDELAALVLEHPESDFLVSPQIARQLGGRQVHDTRRMTLSYVLLLSREARPAGAARWPCRM